MADFAFSDVASKVATPQQMTIGDMVNMARSAQAYKQAEQINPLAVREQQAATELAEGTLKPKIEQQGYQTELAGTQSKKAKFNFTNEQAQVINDESNALMNDPRILKAEDTPAGRQNALMAVVEAKKRALKRGVDEHILEAITAPYISMASTNPSQLRQEMLNSTRAGTGAQGEAALNAPQITTNAAGNLISATPGTGTIAPLSIEQSNQNQQQPPANLNPSTQEVRRAVGGTESNVSNYGDYVKGLAGRVEASNNQVLRTTEARDVLNKFKPGAGTQTYVQLAEKLQAMGAPQGLVDKVAGGDLSAAQSANKFLAQAVIAGVRQAAGGDQARVAEVENYIKNNPTINTDPRALTRLFDFTDKLAKRDFAEQEFLVKQIKNGKFNPETHFGDTQQYLRDSGLIPKLGENKQQSNTQQNNSPKTSGHGKVVAQAIKNGVTYYKYEDGFVGSK